MNYEQYIHELNYYATTYANNCYGNLWRRYLENHLYTNSEVNSKDYDNHIECQRCFSTWCPQLNPFSIHSEIGNFSNFKDIYYARFISYPWIYSINQYTHILSKNYHFKDYYSIYPRISEEDAIKFLKKLIKLYPQIKAWITLQSLQVAIKLQWLNMCIMLSDLLLLRQMWFTSSGSLYHYSKNYSNIINYKCKDFDENMAKIKYKVTNVPFYLMLSDMSATTINNDIAILFWLKDNTSIKLREKLPYILSCNVCQWMVTEQEMCFCKNKKTKIKECCYSKNKQYSNYIITNNIEYTTIINKAIKIRKQRLHGVFYCIVQMYRQARRIHYVPNIGQEYFKALLSFQNQVDIS